jgi:hypothetical protein
MKRKLAHGETRKDFAKTADLIKDRQKRDRPTVAFDSENTKIAEDLVTILKSLNVTLDQVLNTEIRGEKPTLNALKSSDAELRDRLIRYNQNMDESLLPLYKNTLHYVPIHEWKGIALKQPLLVSLELGEVLCTNYDLVGYVMKEKGKMMIQVNGKTVMRSHVILYAAGFDPNPGETADHVDCTKPLNDSIGNLRWATASQQIKNQRKERVMRREAQTIQIVTDDNGCVLKECHSQELMAQELGLNQSTIYTRIKRQTKFIYQSQRCHLIVDNPDPDYPWYIHPDFPNFQCAENGQYRTKPRNQWSTWRYAAPRHDYQYNGKCRKLSIILYEAFNQETVNSSQFVVDHIDNSPSNNSKLNLQKITHSQNVMRTEVKFIIRESIGDGSRVIYVSPKHASAANNGISSKKISHCVNGRGKTAGGFRWRHATDHEIRFTFQKVHAPMPAVS